MRWIGTGLLALALMVATPDPGHGDGGPLPDIDDSLPEALEKLRGERLGEAARVLSARVRQPGPKMKLTRAEAAHAAEGIIRHLPAIPSARALHDVLPRSMVELFRAVVERDLALDHAEAMAAYLVHLVAVMQFGNRAQLDENHSHVIGRDWPQIDYQGENTTWQRRRADWIRHGVVDFRKAIHLHRYFTAEERLPYFRRIYRPAGRMADVSSPAR